MDGFTVNDLLELRESCDGLSRTARAVEILRRGVPWMNHDDILRLSIGARDALLLSLRVATFGPRLDCFAICPACAVKLEFSLDAVGLRSAGTPAVLGRGSIQFRNRRIGYRTLNSEDLLLAEKASDATGAREVLLRRCLERSPRANRKLPEELISRLSEALEKSDPLAVITVNLRCAACNHRWEVLFEVVTHLWKDICDGARRLIREVHTIARAYGWSEEAILRIPGGRRKLYLAEIYG